MRRLVGLAAGGLLLLGALAPGEAGADPAAQARPARRQVVLESTASLPSPAFEETLRELLGRVSLALVRPGGSDPASTLARVRIDPATGGVLVSVYRGAAGAIFVQRDVPAGESSAIFAETVAHVILGAVEPLAQADPEPPAPPPSASAAASAAPPASAPAAPASAAAPAAPAPAPAGEGPRWLLGVRGAARPLGDGLVAWGAGASAAVELPWAARPSLAVEGAWQPAGGITREEVKATVRLTSLRATARLQALRWGPLAFEPGLGGGVDVLAVTPRSGPGNAHLAPATTRLQPVLTAALGGRVRLGSMLDAVVTAGLDIDTAPRRWVLQTGGGPAPIFEPSLARPFVSIGLDLSLPRRPEAP